MTTPTNINISIDTDALRNDIDATPADIKRYVALLRGAVEAVYPGAEIEIYPTHSRNVQAWDADANDEEIDISDEIYAIAERVHQSHEMTWDNDDAVS